MESTSKQMLILKAIVDHYIATGEPVASKTICDELDCKMSSATVRNYMAQLMKSGYIIQPHTSAGRIPSDKGYEVYIEHFAKQDVLNEVRDYIDNAFSQCDNEPDSVLKVAADTLAELCEGFSFAITPVSPSARIYGVRFVRIGRYTAMAVLITSSGVVKTGLMRCEYVVTDEVINIFEKLIGDRFTGVPVNSVNSAFLQSTAISMGQLGMLMSNVLWTVGRLCGLADEVTAFTSRTGFIAGEEDGTDRERLLMFLSDKSELARLAKNCSDGVYFGSSTDFKELDNLVVISSRYITSEESSGTISVICPTRTNYHRNISAVRYASAEVGRLIKAIIGEEENI